MAAVVAWSLVGILLVVLVATSYDHWRQGREIAGLKLKHQTELRVERDTHRSIQQGAQRQIGILEERLAKAEQAVYSPVYIRMQSMENRFLMHDFVIAQVNTKDVEGLLRINVERAMRDLEEKARRELVAIFTDPVVESYDDINGKVYRVTVGVFPKFQLAPDSGEFEIQGHRVLIQFDDDGTQQELYTSVPIIFSRRRGD